MLVKFESNDINKDEDDEILSNKELMKRVATSNDEDD